MFRAGTRADILNRVEFREYATAVFYSVSCQFGKNFVLLHRLSDKYEQ